MLDGFLVRYTGGLTETSDKTRLVMIPWQTKRQIDGTVSVSGLSVRPFLQLPLEVPPRRQCIFCLAIQRYKPVTYRNTASYSSETSMGSLFSPTTDGLDIVDRLEHVCNKSGRSRSRVEATTEYRICLFASGLVANIEI